MVLSLCLAVVCLTGSGLLPTLARWALATIRPSLAVPVLVASSLTAAFGLGFSLSTLAISTLAGWGPIARSGGVSLTILRAIDPLPGWLGTAAAVTVAVFLGRAVMQAAIVAVHFVQSARVCRRLPGSGPVVFTDGDDIVTLAGFPGRIVVGSALFDQLDAQDRRVVLAHELSHLRRRHHWYVQAADIAAAANPLLIPIRGLVRLGIERWADEDSVGPNGAADRRLAARALARVALQRKRIHSARPAVTRGTLLPGALAAAALVVTTRVRALLEPPKPSHTARTLAIAAVSVAVLAAGLCSLVYVNDVIEIAQLGNWSR